MLGSHSNSQSKQSGNKQFWATIQRCCVAAICAVLCYSCTSPPKAERLFGLHRTDLEKWNVRELPLAQATIEVPSAAFEVGDGVEEVSISLHPYYPQVLDDVRPLINISFKRMTVSGLKDRLASLLKYHGDQEMRWRFRVHSQIDRWDDQTVSCYRCDYMIDSNNMWFGLVESISPVMLNSNAHDKEDDAAIRRIMRSFTPYGINTHP